MTERPGEGDTEKAAAKRVRQIGAGLFAVGLLACVGAILGSVSQWLPYALFTAMTFVGLRLLIGGRWA